MRAIDTNGLARLLARDDAPQFAVAETFIAKCAWVPLLALVETVRCCLRLRTQTCADHGRYHMLLNHQHLMLERGGIVAAALVHYLGKSGNRDSAIA